jgi:hypothetical protein
LAGYTLKTKCRNLSIIITFFFPLSLLAIGKLQNHLIFELFGEISPIKKLKSWCQGAKLPPVCQSFSRPSKQASNERTDGRTKERTNE